MSRTKQVLHHKNLILDFDSSEDTLESGEFENHNEDDSSDERDANRVMRSLPNDLVGENDGSSEDGSNGQAPTENSEEESEEEVRANDHQRRAIVVKDFRQVDLIVTKTKDVKQFKKEARCLGYIDNTFPSTGDVTAGTAECAMKVLGLSFNQDFRYHADQSLRKMYCKAVSDARSALVSSVKETLVDYQFDIVALQQNNVTTHRSRKQYHWLLNGSRETFVYPDLRVIGSMTMMCFMLAKTFRHKTVQNKPNDEFSEKSEWRNVYYGMLEGPESRLVNWKKALETQQAVVDSLQRSNSGSSFCLADLLTVQDESEGEERDE
ncbi:hypothetical protein BJV82DRAFT_584083 [Fennellomyces sp. T-0311]|nr:hypothetical protein BJV82DRAFT_584083 [Fennellomyces sp. T-0311]